MEKMKQMLSEELRGWRTWEVVWLFLSCSVILGLSLYWNDTWIGIISAISGTACVVLTGKGKLSAYGFGLINIVLYAYISYEAKYYGEVMLNMLYYFPMQFYGFYVWSRNMDAETHEVKKQKMSPKLRVITAAAILAGSLLYGLLLRAINGALPFVDAFSTVASVAAMIISIKMYAEQWLLWIVIDAVTVFMWGIAFAKGNDSIATLIMWMVYLVNAILMQIKWSREAGKHGA